MGSIRVHFIIRIAKYAISELNEGEFRNALARAVFFNRLVEIRDRSFEQQRYRASDHQLGDGGCRTVE